MKKVQLDEAEVMAIDTFLAENWRAFCRVAEQFLSEEELESLENKLKEGH
jgi:hypothetical protein